MIVLVSDEVQVMMFLFMLLLLLIRYWGMGKGE